MDSNSSKVCGAPEAARRLGVTKELISRYCRQGRIAGAALVSGVWMIPGTGLRRFVKEHKTYKPGRPAMRRSAV